MDPPKVAARNMDPKITQDRSIRISISILSGKFTGRFEATIIMAKITWVSAMYETISTI